MEKEREIYILREKYLKEIASRENENIKLTEKSLKVDMSLNELAKLMMKDMEE